MQDTEVYVTLLRKARQGQRLTEGEWHEVMAQAEQSLPGFYHFLAASTLTATGRRVCLLLRLGLRLKEAACLAGISSPYASKLCRLMLRQLFRQVGTGKDLQRSLGGIG